ncbi:DUF4307 domain-containing protein [Demequina sp. B12]|uniref:DUF4307 domain-containing protein n=1 Tax=Demequina sp. B12 TaxID=2992757 RepID=UPI00237B6B99|nr:DUF4307 domain-containing protein [Demequina sp. B12]MDE0573790.1 DUF4307 domain-containing protein [Demequina sp. B12]
MSNAPDHETEEELSDAVPHLSKKGWTWVTVGLVALTGIATWYGVGQADQAARWATVGFSIDSATDAEVTFDVHLYTDETVECQVRAMNTSFAEVGVATVTVDPAEGESQRLTVPITTVEEATTAEVNYCDVPR